jgi:hypothetical protein
VIEWHDCGEPKPSPVGEKGEMSKDLKKPEIYVFFFDQKGLMGGLGL